MNDIIGPKVTTPVVVRSEAPESAWEAARSRQARARETVSRCIDKRIGSAGNAPVPAEPADRAFSVIANSSADPITAMNMRGLLLADALQRHALLKIAETGIILDEIDRTVADTINEKFHAGIAEP